MTLKPESILPGEDHSGRGFPWCDVCGNTMDLYIESVDASPRGLDEILKISATCMDCGGYYVHDLSPDSFMPEKLNRLPSQDTEAADGFYLHCDEPMTKGISTERAGTATLASRTDGESELEVYVRTMVLHCRCGFRRESAAAREG